MTLLRDAAQLAPYLNRLHFPPDLERAFRADFFEKSVPIQRAAVITGVVVYGLFAVLDAWAPAETRNALWLIRGTVIVILLGLFAVSFTPLYAPWFQLIGSIGLFSVSAGIIATQLLTSETDFGYSLFIASMMLAAMATFTLVRLRFTYATSVGWLMFALYIGVSLWRGTASSLMTFITSVFFLVVTNIMGMLVAYFTELYLRRDFLQRQMLEQERAKSEHLLLNILPGLVAERLKKGEIIADHFDNASVLFADIVGFTPLSATLPAEKVVTLLNEVFTAFDHLATRYNVEKVKTIGDAYMVVSGVPEECADHAVRLAAMGLEMCHEMHRLRQHWGADVQIRIGIHSGPVVAGVIGLKKFIYDLWGDTVNTASRMESSGVPSRVQVSEATYHLLKDQFSFEPRGVITVKGKGEMRVYLLNQSPNPSITQ